MTDIDLKKAFYMEPKEVVKYFESKGLKTSFDWHEVYEDAHAKAFTVAKMTQADLLKDTHDMLTTAIKEGWSEGKFSKNATELFEKKGWTGKKEVINPNTGKKQTVELGTPRRIKKIFQCNMHSAYAVGKYKSQLERAEVAPYFQYVCILDGRTRPAHRAMNGKVFRYDDPIWNTMYPPNGWNCRCMVRQLSEGDIRRKGLKVETSEGHLTEVSENVGGEMKTNSVYTFSSGGNVYHLKPDAGWNNNAGKAAYLDDILIGKIEKMPMEVKKHFIEEIAEKQKVTPKTVQNLYRKIIPLHKAAEMNLEQKDLYILQKYTHNSNPYNKAILNVNRTKAEQERIDALSAVFDKAVKTQQEYITYRGEGIGIFKNIEYNEKIKNFEQLYKMMKNVQNENNIYDVINHLQGMTVIQDLFMSTSFEIKKALEYSKNAEEPRLLWTITAKEGTKAIDTRYLSSKKWEEELLFDRGQQLKIDDIEYDKRNKIWKITALVMI